MIIKPMVRNNICLNSHPEGCVVSVMKQISYTTKLFGYAEPPSGAPKLALIIGCSTGYGLASRIACAFGYRTATVGISFEKAGTPTKCGTPGFYNNLSFDREAAVRRRPSRTLDGDAFSNEMKDRAIAAVRELAVSAGIVPQIDLVIYSLASPVRTDPKTGVMYRSVIKPIGQSFSGDTIDMMTGAIVMVKAEPATPDEIASTIKVMGGEDWELWIDALEAAGILAPAARTVAYTYIGPELSWAIYKNGTIGRAKEDLERAARAINGRFAGTAKKAYISVNKALVTRASAVIPIIPFYVSCLFKVMKAKGVHEGCIEQICRLFRERLYTDEAMENPEKIPLDSEGRIRIDDLEMRPDVQEETARLTTQITEANIWTKTDAAGFKHDFLAVHGFDDALVNYEADINPAIIV